MAQIKFTTSGTCSRSITVEVDDDGIIRYASFEGGCNGNLKGICSLVKGRKASEVKQDLQGIICGNKTTSCPDQLAKALAELGY